MKVPLASLLLILILLSSLVAQPIFIPFKGERQLLKVSNWTDEEIAHKGQRCGDYFLYEVVGVAGDQHVVTLKAQVTDQEERRAIYGLTRIDASGILIRLDEDKSSPTGEWVHPEKVTGIPRTMLIRISPRDYVASPCLLQNVLVGNTAFDAQKPDGSLKTTRQQALSLNGTDQGKHVSTKVGQEIIVTLQTIGPGGQYEAPRVSSSSVRFEGSYFPKEQVPAGPTQVYRFMSAAAGEAKVDIPHSGENRAYQITVHVKQN
jgi:hypothetical protein